ncbi:MAG TPA: hypothetical protein VKZ96_17060 [Thermomicrobiales bacterium]|nr:hypothetical protein [Thermomicrobiales bacterium]
MPGAKDLAALPTSWGLTIWDALPIFLAVEVAVAIVILAALPVGARATVWRHSASLLIGGAAYLLAFESELILPFAIIAVATVGASQLRASGEQPQVPSSVGSGAMSRAWDVIGSVAASSAVAAAVKILLVPYLPVDSLVWLFMAVCGGLIPIGTTGTAAIPALALTAGGGTALHGVVWLAVAAARPYLFLRLTRTTRLRDAPTTGN